MINLIENDKKRLEQYKAYAELMDAQNNKNSMNLKFILKDN